jgi:glycosyltransferase involved in cell wall biosynthesis
MAEEPARGPAILPEPSPPVSAARGSRWRLLLLTPALGTAGPDRALLALAPRLRREGFEVTVAALGGWGPLGDDLEARGVRAVALGRRSRWDPRAAGRLLSILRRERIQVVHAHRFAASLAARLIGRAAGVPVVITAHHDCGARVSWPRRLGERLTATLSDAVVAGSQEARRQAIEAYGIGAGAARTVRAAVEVPAEPPDPAARDRVRRDMGAGPSDLLVGTVGRLDEPREGPAVFLAAARLLAHEVSRVRLALLGEGPPRAWLEACAAREGVGHRTVICGPRRDLVEALGALDLFVQPSSRDDSGLTLLEAMAAGTPVVAAGLPGVVDDETGVLVQPGDPEALAGACVLLLRDRERAARQARAARARVVREFRIERLVTELSDLYRELLQGRRGAGGPGEAPAGGAE